MPNRTVPFTVHIPADLHRQFKAVAALHGATMTAMTMAAIRNAVEHQLEPPKEEAQPVKAA
jgi:hypothetical protein